MSLYQGIPGANSEIAVRQHFGDDVEALPCRDFNHLFDALMTDAVEFSLLPVENAFSGSVSGAYELLLDHDVRIQAEVILHGHHALLANQGAAMQDISQVRSHPQALMACQRYLKRHNLEPVAGTIQPARRMICRRIRSPVLASSHLPWRANSMNWTFGQ